MEKDVSEGRCHCSMTVLQDAAGEDRHGSFLRHGEMCGGNNLPESTSIASGTSYMLALSADGVSAAR